MGLLFFHRFGMDHISGISQRPGLANLLEDNGRQPTTKVLVVEFGNQGLVQIKGLGSLGHHQDLYLGHALVRDKNHLVLIGWQLGKVSVGRRYLEFFWQIAFFQQIRHGIGCAWTVVKGRVLVTGQTLQTLFQISNRDLIQQTGRQFSPQRRTVAIISIVEHAQLQDFALVFLSIGPTLFHIRDHFLQDRFVGRKIAHQLFNQSNALLQRTVQA